MYSLESIKISGGPTMFKIAIILGSTRSQANGRALFNRRIVKSSATFCRRKLHLDFSIPRPCVDGYLNL
ncbi:hypothetical protein CJP55_00010 [Lactobacillus plantarum]|nr:hypothetical protein [Lactiplantibacillus plantarum]